MSTVATSSETLKTIQENPPIEFLGLQVREFLSFVMPQVWMLGRNVNLAALTVANKEVPGLWGSKAYLEFYDDVMRLVQDVPSAFKFIALLKRAASYDRAFSNYMTSLVVLGRQLAVVTNGVVGAEQMRPDRLDTLRNYYAEQAREPEREGE